MTPSCPEEIFQHLAFPAIPYFWTGASNIRYGKQIKRYETAFVPDARGKVFNHTRIGNVFLLGRDRHHQMIFYQPRNQLRIFRRHPMLFAETRGVGFAKYRMISFASFSDVMEQSGKVEHFRVFELADEAAA